MPLRAGRDQYPAEVSSASIAAFASSSASQGSGSSVR
jgi:hypothetical protein